MYQINNIYVVDNEEPRKSNCHQSFNFWNQGLLKFLLVIPDLGILRIIN